MAKKKNTMQTSATVVRVEILPTMEVAFSVSDPENWTRGPLLSVNANKPTAKNKKAVARRKKRV